MPTTTERRWRAQERRLADQDGLEQQPASGAGLRKGDAVGENTCVSAKSTQAMSFPLRASDVRKMIADAKTHDKIPIMQVELGDGTLLGVMRWEDLAAMIKL